MNCVLELPILSCAGSLDGCLIVRAKSLKSVLGQFWEKQICQVRDSLLLAQVSVGASSQGDTLRVERDLVESLWSLCHYQLSMFPIKLEHCKRAGKGTPGISVLNTKTAKTGMRGHHFISRWSWYLSMTNRRNTATARSFWLQQNHRNNKI